MKPAEDVVIPLFSLRAGEGYPVDQAADVAMTQVAKFLASHKNDAHKNIRIRFVTNDSSQAAQFNSAKSKIGKSGLKGIVKWHQGSQKKELKERLRNQVKVETGNIADVEADILFVPTLPNLAGGPVQDAIAKKSAQEVVETRVSASTGLPKGMKKIEDDLSFKQINSSQTRKLDSKTPIRNRADFKNQSTPAEAVAVSKSEFVPDNLVSVAMRQKKDSALGIKYQQGDRITNGLAAMHTFINPIAPVAMTGDYRYHGSVGHTIADFKDNKVRDVVLSASIQPDYESNPPDSVMGMITQLSDQAIEGEPLPPDFVYPSAKALKNPEIRATTDLALTKHMIYHLSPSHRLPSLKEVEGKTLNFEKGLELLEQALTDPNIDPETALKGQYIKLPNGNVLALDVLFASYVHQVRNEFSVLDKTLPQGYVYTIDPPAIFIRALGAIETKADGSVNLDKMGAPDKEGLLLNRLQIAAFKHLAKDPEAFKNLKMIAFNDFRDNPTNQKVNYNSKQGAISLFQQALKPRVEGQQLQIKAKKELFDEKTGFYKESEDTKGYALVLHNNSDAFGQNIEFEGASSMDGVIGSFSNAFKQLDRHREGLLDHIV